MPAYYYAVLGADPAANRALASAPGTLGVEITDPGLAGLPDLGNIDPQHTGSRYPGQPPTPRDNDRAAIQDALTWPLPPKKTVLLTSKPDADSVGCWAVFEARAAGEILRRDTLQRVELIAMADRQRTNPWPGPSEPRPENLLGPCPAIADVAFDRGLSLQRRVELIRRWITTGILDDEKQRLERLHAYAQEAIGAFVNLGDSLVAVVEGDFRLGNSAVYLHAPAGVAGNNHYEFPDGTRGRKITVVRYNDRTFPGLDWEALKAELNAVDPAVAVHGRWGGSDSIIGSPQGGPTRLTLRQVEAIYRRYLARAVDGEGDAVSVAT